MRQSTSSGSAGFNKLAAGVGITLLGRFAGRAIQLLGQIALARLLGPEAFGLYAISLTILTMVGFVSPLGLDYGVIQYGSRHWNIDSAGLKGVLLWSIGLALFSGLLIGGGLYTAAPWLGEQVFQKPELVSVMRWLSPAFALIGGLRVVAAATRISQQMQYSVCVQDIAQPAISLILVLFFWFLGWRLFGAIVANVVSFAIAFFLALYFLKSLYPNVSYRYKVLSEFSPRELLIFSLPATIEAITYNFTFRVVDRLFVGYFLSTDEVGIYQAASQLAVSFAIIMGSFTAILSPMISDLYRRGKMAELQNLFRVSTKWGVYLSLPAFVLICVAPHEVMTVIFGVHYESGALPLLILTVAQLINVGTGAVGPMLIMTGHQNRWFLISVIVLCVMLVLNYVLIPSFGLLGAALGSTCGTVGLSVLGLYQLKLSLGMWPYDKGYLKGILAILLAAGALFLLRLIPGGGTGIGLLALLIIAGGIISATLLTLGLDSEDKELVHQIQLRIWSSKIWSSRATVSDL
jgi:O-antigen/teichoic acid export membrane protein